MNNSTIDLETLAHVTGGRRVMIIPPNINNPNGVFADAPDLPPPPRPAPIDPNNQMGIPQNGKPLLK
jgi:hypothetical protein